jgi:hypothetical protein
MRELEDKDIQDTVLYIFYEIIHPYMDFYKKKEFTKILKINVFDKMDFMLHWKKVGKRFYLFTKVFPVLNYELTDDDKYALSYFEDFLTPRNIDKITKWYDSRSKEEFNLKSSSRI